MYGVSPTILEMALRLQEQSCDPLCAYLYDLNALDHHVRHVVESLPSNCQLFYAVKANADTEILHTLSQHVDGFEVASGGELEWVRQRFGDIPIIFGGPGKLESSLRRAVQESVELIHVESRLELKRLQAIATELNKPVDILLRMNVAWDDLPQTTLSMGGRPTPFGLDLSELPMVLEALRSSSHLGLRGFHFHLLSHQLDAAEHIRLLRHYFTLVKQWQIDYGLSIDHINVGGGIGINYRQPQQQFNWPEFSESLAALMESESMQGYHIRFECGRYLTAACGYYVMEVLDIKKNLGEWFAICRGGTHHFRTPYAQRHSHPFVVVNQAGLCHEPECTIRKVPVTVVGQLCTPKDLLAYNVMVEKLTVGDLLIFPYAGAYAWNISPHEFLRHPPPVVRYLGRYEREFPETLKNVTEVVDY